MKNTARYALLNNSRFYVLTSGLLLSAIVVAAARISITDTQLMYIRIEQLFGLIAIVYWYIAVVISPLGYVIGKKRVVGLAYARRAVGVLAAYFALLHSAVALWGQLGGIENLDQLPLAFKISIGFGAVSLVVLVTMAATSFDRVIAYIRFRRWKWLHRLGYIALVVVVFHIWMIGTHVSYGLVQTTAFVALAVLSGLETFRIVSLLTNKYSQIKGKDYFFTIFVTGWAVWLALLLSLPAIVQNYHSQRHTGVHQSIEGDE